MQIAGIRIRRRVFVSMGLVVAVTGAWVYWSRANQPKNTPVADAQPASFVRIGGAGQGESGKVLAERAEYFDPTPLFLPTNRNFRQGELPDRVMEPPGQVFHDFPPKLNFADTLPEYGVPTETGSNSLPEVLGRGNDAPFAGFGAVDRSIEPLMRRGGYIDVKALKSGVLNISEALNDAELPQVDYSPVEFIVAVARSGLIGDPVIMTTSGKEEVDGKLKDYLVKVYRIGERLAPGQYVVLIGP
jgi:hypothetical protein